MNQTSLTAVSLHFLKNALPFIEGRGSDDAVHVARPVEVEIHVARLADGEAVTLGAAPGEAGDM